MEAPPLRPTCTTHLEAQMLEKGHHGRSEPGSSCISDKSLICGLSLPQNLEIISVEGWLAELQGRLAATKASVGSDPPFFSPKTTNGKPAIRLQSAQTLGLSDSALEHPMALCATLFRSKPSNFEHGLLELHPCTTRLHQLPPSAFT